MRLGLGFVATLSLGICPAIAAAAVFTFDAPGEVTLGVTKAPSVWYADRYPPAGFASGQNGGGRIGVLLENISVDDSATNRPAAFSTAFYNTQGRKYDLATGTNALFIDLYVPSSWDALLQNDGRVASLWATGLGAGNSLTNNYPIIEFNNNRPDNAGDGFRVWNSVGSVWFNVGGFGGYNQWHRIGFLIGGGQEQFFVNGNLVGTVNDPATTQFGNVILQGHNSGQSYNVAWDNLSATTNLLDAVPEPATLSMFGVGLAVAGVAALRRSAGSRLS